MAAVNITCQNVHHCKRQHALFWYVDATGKRDLRYRCDKIWKSKKTGLINQDGTEQVTHYYGVGMLPFEHEGKLDVPEIWSAGWKKKQSDKRQEKLTI